MKDQESNADGWDEAGRLMRQGAGVVIDDDEARILPKVNIDQPVRALGMQLSGVLRLCPIFLWGNSRDVVTIQPNGKREVMSPARLASWVEKYCVTFKPRGKYDQDVSMGKDLAVKVLECDDFLHGLRRVDGLAPVRMPVRRECGKIELLEEGYDVESRILTIDGVDFAKDMTLMDAAAVFERILGDFPWADMAPGRGGFFANRSVAVMLHAMLVNFCRYLWRQGDLRPLILFVANQQGSGKSLLAQLCLCSIYGVVASADLPEGKGGKEELKKYLDTEAQALAPYVFFDDVPGGIFSNALNRFLTSPVHRGRKLGTADTFEAPNMTQLVATGNNVELSADIMRRSLVSELFLAGDVEGRTYHQPLTSADCNDEKLRGEILAAMWAFVRHWIERDCPRLPGKATFEAITGDVAGMLEAAGVSASPLDVPELPMAGDVEQQEWKTLLTAIATSLEDVSSVEFTREEIAAKAREMDLLIDLVGVEDKLMNSDAAKRFGRRIQRWRGRLMVDGRGRKFQFGARRQHRNRSYPLVFI